MSYGDDITTPSGLEPGDEVDELGPADYETEDEFDPEDDPDWHDIDEAGTG
jgi:hypothetical protein